MKGCDVSMVTQTHFCDSILAVMDSSGNMQDKIVQTHNFLHKTFSTEQYTIHKIWTSPITSLGRQTDEADSCQWKLFVSDVFILR